MRDYLKQYVESVVEHSDMDEAMPEESDVVQLTYSELFDLIQNAKREVE